ncbi:MAG: polyprenyl synthetase family protein [Bacteroidaceae bacterium]|nr:polyprenyl synthetase family protein [Bacteroidaceae bacterium]MBR4044613.1 polyprenyl synthetase family protein [Bacteroidaceae bacterium]
MTYSAQQLLGKVNAYLKQMPYSRPPKGLYEPIAYELDLGGKRVRPVLMLMGYNLYREDVDTILPQAAGLETYHNHTLLHDDVMDHADMRRGKPTVHNVWDENTAILSGDAMLILAYRLMAQCPADKLPQVLGIFTETTMEICEGQQWDMEFEKRMDVKVDEYVEMIRLKTSVLLAAALKIGACLAGAPEEDARKLYDFGMKMGLAFQLQDDWLDVYGDPKVFGKNIGGDILCNKKTYMLITALQQADDAQRAELEGWLSATNCEPAEKIAAVTRLYNKVGVGERCMERVEAYYNEGLAVLDSVALPAERKQVLKEFACSLMNRKV